MAKGGRYLHKRLKYKASLRQARVRDPQITALKDPRTIQQEVKINASWSPALPTTTAQLSFDGQESCTQLLRRQGGEQLNYSI